MSNTADGELEKLEIKHPERINKTENRGKSLRETWDVVKNL